MSGGSWDIFWKIRAETEAAKSGRDELVYLLTKYKNIVSQKPL